MRKRSSTGDVAQNARRVVEQAIGGALNGAREPIEFPSPQKNPAAVALGRLGGRKGGKARAEKLTAEERKAIAQRAANTRWAKEKTTL